MPITSRGALVLQDKFGAKRRDKHSSGCIVDKEGLLRSAFCNGLPPRIPAGADPLFNDIRIEHAGKPTEGRGEEALLGLCMSTDLDQPQSQCMNSRGWNAFDHTLPLINLPSIDEEPETSKGTCRQI